MLTYFPLHAPLGICVLVCVCVSMCGCFRASPALAATSAAVMLSSFWRTRNVSAGPTTLAAPSQRDAHTHIEMDLEWNSKTCRPHTLTETWRRCYLMLMKLLVVRCILSASSSNSFTPSYKLRGLPKTETNHYPPCMDRMMLWAWQHWHHRSCASYLSWTGGQNNDLAECRPLVGDDVPILLLAPCALNQRQPLLLQALPSISRDSLCRLGGRRGEGLGRSCGWDWSGGVGRRCITGTRNWSGFLRFTGDAVCLFVTTKEQSATASVWLPPVNTADSGCWHTSLRVMASFSAGSVLRETEWCFQTNSTASLFHFSRIWFPHFHTGQESIWIYSKILDQCPSHKSKTCKRVHLTEWNMKE